MMRLPCVGFVKISESKGILNKSKILIIGYVGKSKVDYNI